MYKILIVDDHPIYREGLKLAIQSDQRIGSVSEAETAENALIFLRKESFDLILLDLYMPGMNGIEFLKKKREDGNKTKVIVLSTEENIDVIQNARSHGADGYIQKGAGRKEILEMIYRTLTDKRKVIISSKYKKKLNQKEKDIKKEMLLTEKESTVLIGIVNGEASKEIAIEMGITERTVKAHLSNIYNKFGVKSRTEAVAYALINGCVDITKVQ